MTITSHQVKELREKTGVGMLECKQALVETGGRIEEAIEYLRKKGLSASSKKAGRVAAEGLVALHLSSDAKSGVLVEINCETDFVAKGDDFQRLAADLAQLAFKQNPSDLDSFLKIPFRKSKSVEDELSLLVAKIGEKIALRRFGRLEAGDSEKIGSYIHLGNKIGVLVKLSGLKLNDRIARDIAMHVAASHPFYLNKSDIPPETIEKEKSIYREQLKDSGKEGKIVEKIVEGKLAKFASELCLNEQIFIKDPAGKKTVAEALKGIDPSLKVAAYVRYQVGEGMEKK